LLGALNGIVISQSSDQSVSSHPDHGILIIFLDNNFFYLICQEEKKRKNQRSLEKERIKGESEEKRRFVSSPLELTVEGEKGRERKGGRDWESESG